MTKIEQAIVYQEEVIRDLDNCTWECERCGESTPIKDMDLADPARKALDLLRSVPGPATTQEITNILLSMNMPSKFSSRKIFRAAEDRLLGKERKESQV